MTITYPYPVSYLSDKMKISGVTFDIQRNDELSTSGSGDTWQAELSPPLWIATVTIMNDYNNTVKQIAAKLRKLHGAQEQFLLVDPLSKYPASDPTGAVISGSIITVDEVGSDRQSIKFSGLPGLFKLTTGDKFTITYGSNPVIFSYHEISEDITTDALGAMEFVQIFPHLPTSVAEGFNVIMNKPPCKMSVSTGSFTSGRSSGLMTDGLSFKAIQKKK